MTPIAHRLGGLAAAALIAVAAAQPASAQSASLADAYKVIVGKEFVELTHSFSPTTPVWSGFGQATMTAAADPKSHEPYTIEKSGFRTTYYSMVGQYGTHIDPPASAIWLMTTVVLGLTAVLA